MIRQANSMPEASCTAVRSISDPALCRYEAEADIAADAAVAGRRVSWNRTVQPSPSAFTPPGCLNAAGAPLAHAVQSEMESCFGSDFSQIRIHTDRTAAQAAERRAASAYADGHNLVFGAGQYQPWSRTGRHLIAHELAHVLQWRKGAPRFLRKPLTYDPTRITITPPPQPLTLAEAQAMTQEAIKDGKLTAATVSGAKAGSTEEIMLHYILASSASQDRWGTEVDLVAAIGFAAPPNAAPLGKVTVRIDGKGAGSAVLVSAGAVNLPTAYTKQEDAEKELKSTYGFSEVKDSTDANWTLAELNIVIGALARVPASDVSALKGVTLLRVRTITGGDNAGEFGSQQGVEGTTVTDEHTLKLADDVFPSSQTNFTGGRGNEASASYLTVLHEVGHAVESKAQRDAATAENKAIAARNKLVGEHEPLLATEESELATLNASITELNALSNEANDLGRALDNARRSGDRGAIAAARAELNTKLQERTSKNAEVTANRARFNQAKAREQAKAVQIKTATTTQTSREKASESVSARPILLERAVRAAGAAGAALSRAKSSAAARTPDSEAYRTAAEDAGKALTAFGKAVADKADNVDDLRSTAESAVATVETERESFEKANGSDAAVAVYAPVVQAQRAWFDALALVLDAGGQSARVRKFVDFVTANKIEPFTKYASNNWPDKPGEFFAEAYSLFLSDPEYLRTNSVDLYNWFRRGQYR